MAAWHSGTLYQLSMLFLYGRGEFSISVTDNTDYDPAQDDKKDDSIGSAGSLAHRSERSKGI